MLQITSTVFDQRNILFSSQEMDLRATQYLPDIVKLQQCLYSTFNRLKDKMDAKNQTIGEFIQELPDGIVTVASLKALHYHCFTKFNIKILQMVQFRLNTVK